MSRSLKDFYNEVSRIADTDKQEIDVADTYRVLSCAFRVLETYDHEGVCEILTQGFSLSGVDLKPS